MPEHDPTTLPVKRLNYYQYQFLNAGDFTAEQDYHRGMRYRLNRSLHSPGVADGLDVTPKGNQLAVDVAPGLAIDGEGREMVILPPGKEVTLTGLDGDVFVAIEYRATEDDPATSTGTPGNTRMNEDPHVAASAQQPTGNQILLAKVKIANNVVTEVDTSTRPLASAVARADQVLSQQIKEADGGSGQNTNIGSGIKTGHIQDGAVTTPKLADDAVTSGKLAPADGTSGQDVNSGAGVKTGHLQDGAVTGPKVQDGSVSGAKLVDNSVQGGKLADNSLAGTKLQNLTVTGAKVADNSLPGAKLQDASVAGGKLVDNSVPGTKLADNSVQGAKVADNSLAGTKVQDLTVAGGKLVDNSVSGAKLVDNSVPGGKLTDNSVPGTKLQALSVAGDRLAERTIPQTKHVLNSISFAELKKFTGGPFKIVTALTTAALSALNSATGLQLTNFGLFLPQTAGYPEPATQTALSAFADHVLNEYNVVAVTPDAGVSMGNLRFEFTPRTFYFPGANPNLNRNVIITAFGSGVTVGAGTTPNLTVWVTFTTIPAT